VQLNCIKQKRKILVVVASCSLLIYKLNAQQLNWSSFAAHEREIQVLTGLKHPGIPSYLDGLVLVFWEMESLWLFGPKNKAM